MEYLILNKKGRFLIFRIPFAFTKAPPQQCQVQHAVMIIKVAFTPYSGIKRSVFCVERLCCDAITHLLHTAMSHLDTRKGNYVEMLFVDYSSAFNTIIPFKLTIKRSWDCQWISSFLARSPQAVQVGRQVSHALS